MCHCHTNSVPWCATVVSRGCAGSTPKGELGRVPLGVAQSIKMLSKKNTVVSLDLGRDRGHLEPSPGRFGTVKSLSVAATG